MGVVEECKYLWNMYQDNCAHARHHEAQRMSLLGATVGIGGGLFAIVGWDQKVLTSDLPLLILAVILGLFSATMTAKFTERASLHAARARAYRNALDSQLTIASLLDLKRSGDERNGVRHPNMSQLRLRWLWVSIHLAVAVIGLILVAQVMI